MDIPDINDLKKFHSDLHNSILQADPSTIEAKADIWEMVDFKGALKKLIDKYEDKFREIYGDL